MPDAQTSRLRTTVQLPFQTEESIGLNVEKIQSLCQLSGFSHLRIQNQEDPKTSKSAVMPVGINSFNTAIGGKASIETEPIYLEETDLSHQAFRKQSRWFNLKISLNQEEMKQRMLLSKKDLREATHWARDINQALTQGIVRAGVKQLFSGLSTEEKSTSAFVYGLGLFNASSPVGLVSYFATMALVSNYFQIYRFGGENFKEGSGHRYSLFLGPELDRALILLIIAHTQKLAKPVELKSTN